ncbi:DUF192 domain-containing protein [Salinimonas marina]|uniref:DUF192 domain-containing protein n=1 Tax=Salinimonas marina TaxID=2785918 RepID=A0A7S9HD57_9ALTE|nr:DUF192 domain-containing protein [Salinimonas marina]QPG05206.1 DUF192 domain-containing protein [Salinimonas marina]
MHYKLSAPIIIALLALWLVLNSSVEARQSVEFEQASVTLNGQTYAVDFAQSPQQRAQGLMFRKSLCSDCGMLFRFSPPKQASMWMKNTYIPLDVAFIDKAGMITDIKPLQPHDLTSVGASAKVMYALEMNQGWFARHDIQVGDHIVIKP